MKTVLVADNESDIRYLIAFVLARSGYRVIEASDGESALRMALKHHPDIMILDIRMPGMSGLDVCAAIRKNAATKDTPVIFCTAFKIKSYVDRAEELGCAAYVVKPFDVGGLVRTVEEALCQHSTGDVQPHHQTESRD